MTLEQLSNVGKRIKEIRQKRGLSVRELAKKMDTSHSYISRVENGKVTPSLETLVKMAEVLECNVSDFFDNENKIEADEELKKEGVEWIILGKELEKEGITLEQVKEWIRAIKATKEL
jgi:XRE family transcriptional regulator, master regulator for biofilm formation